jgi:hypothetical protein
MVSMSQRIQTCHWRDHIFYLGMALLFGLTVFIGFSRTYYLKDFFGTPHLSRVAHIHGAVFTAWMVFFICQTALITTGRTGLHRRIGAVGAILSLGVLMVGTIMTLHSVRAGYASGRPGMASLLINALMDLLLFCIFFAAGLLFRQKKEMHKRLMMLAMLSFIIPALGRLPIPFTMIGWLILVFSLTGVIYDGIFLRRVYLTNIIGALLINVSTPLRFIIEDSRAWQNFSAWIAS